MKKTLAIACLTLLFACAEQPKAVVPPTPHQVQKTTLFAMLPVTENNIVFLGDSLTEGCEWSELLQNTDVKNRGVTADRTDDILMRLDPIVAGKPRKVFLMAGVNDMGWQNKTPDHVAANIRKIVERFEKESPDTEIYLQSLMPVGKEDADNPYINYLRKKEDIKAANALIKSLADEKGLIYIDLYPLFADSEGNLKAEYTNDGLHLLGEYYIIWKDAVIKYINN